MLVNERSSEKVITPKYYHRVQNHEISIIMPSYKAADTISAALSELCVVLTEQNYSFEVIVVIDGLVDETRSVVEALKNKNTRVIEHPINFGKGHALRTGIGRATASKYIGYVDSDSDISPWALLDALDILDRQRDVDLVVGSKLHNDSEVSYPLFRKMQSQIFAKLIQFLFNFNIDDTQSGLKLGRAELVKKAALITATDGFAFDLEFLMRANRMGGTFATVPIKLNYQFGSTISVRKYFETIRDVISILALSFHK